ncbi:MAG TPA: hypothetical protein VNC84_05120 [Gammaproteobacteria bacterium]|jgi:tetratricopeptide (TPR) repeat protein|nr:hypothetical protein [Gammaproteobacteria bacterium]
MRIRPIFLFVIPVFISLNFFSPFSFAENQKIQLNAPLFDNLGKFHHPITTKNSLAQRYFDQGLVLFYSFEYGEAIRSFRAAIKADPDCAMCYWGLALALGSKTDMPLNGHELIDAKTMVGFAMEKVDQRNLSERLYIAALAQRYADLPAQKTDEFSGLCSSYSAVTGSSVKKYAFAMKKLSALLPDDADAKTLYAASLFDLTEWDFWSIQGKPNLHTLETINILESAMKIDKNNPGANHLYVHIIEWSQHPEKALPNAKRLSKLVPGSEHLAHMPCHTYYSIGLYHDATLSNQLAIQIYKNYVNSCKAQGFEPEIQYLYYHNYDYLITAASMEGRKKLSINAADELAKQIYPLAEENPALQKMLTDKMLMLVRFGEWEEILKIHPPSSRFQYALAIWYYAQGIAEVKLGKINAANKHLRDLQQIIKQGPINVNLSQTGITLMQIAENILKGMIEDSSGQFGYALIDFKKAVSLQDTMISADPPPWYFPARQLLGAFLFKSRHFAEAKSIFMEDLKKHPHNGWSLYGLSKSLRQLGEDQEADQEADHFNNEFKKSWKYSDIPVPVFLFSLD